MLTHLSPVATGVPDQIFLIIEPVDMRLGIDGLSACIQGRLKSTPCSGGFYLFSNARRNRLKLLLWDGTGVWLAQRRLHQGRFVWPRADSTEVLTHPHLCLSTEAMVVKQVVVKEGFKRGADSTSKCNEVVGVGG